MDFEWNPQKAAANLRKHEVSFHEAASIFEDLLSLTAPDPDHSDEESRWVTVGMSNLGKILLVVHEDRDETTRIISARKLTRSELRDYEEIKKRQSS